MKPENLFCIVSIFVVTILLFYCIDGSKGMLENYDIIDRNVGIFTDIPTGCTSTAGGDIMMCPCGGHCSNGSRCRAMAGCKC